MVDVGNDFTDKGLFLIFHIVLHTVGQLVPRWLTVMFGA